MIDYQKAPYIELKDYKAPEGINSIYIHMKDKKKIRLIYWKKLSTKKDVKGTILLQQGHNEFIEKYYETIQEFLDRNFNVISFDWRGQGMSDKMINNENKQYIEDFNVHDSDLEFIVDKFIKINFNEPLIGVGHSMGGCILLSSLLNDENRFDSMILSAPMLGFKNEIILTSLLPLINLFFKKTSYFLLSKPNMGKETPFSENELTNDPIRYERTLKLIRQKPNIRLWGVTNAWVNAAKKRLLLIRKKILEKEIKTNALIFNSINDKVVDSNKIIEICQKLKNCKIINIPETKHEIFMEKNPHRNLMWSEIDDFLNKRNI